MEHTNRNGNTSSPTTGRAQTLTDGTDLTLTRLPGDTYWLSATRGAMTFAVGLAPDELMQLRTDAAVLLTARAA